MSNTSAKGGVAALIGLCLIWGYNWVVTKEGLRFAGPFDYAALRTLPGAMDGLLLVPADLCHAAGRGCRLGGLYVLERLPAGIAGLSIMAVPAVGILSSRLQLG